MSAKRGGVLFFKIAAWVLAILLVLSCLFTALVWMGSDRFHDLSFALGRKAVFIRDSTDPEVPQYSAALVSRAEISSLAPGNYILAQTGGRVFPAKVLSLSGAGGSILVSEGGIEQTISFREAAAKVESVTLATVPVGRALHRYAVLVSSFPNSLFFLWLPLLLLFLLILLLIFLRRAAKRRRRASFSPGPAPLPAVPPAAGDENDFSLFSPHNLDSIDFSKIDLSDTGLFDIKL